MIDIIKNYIDSKPINKRSIEELQEIILEKEGKSFSTGEIMSVVDYILK